MKRILQVLIVITLTLALASMASAMPPNLGGSDTYGGDPVDQYGRLSDPSFDPLIDSGNYFNNPGTACYTKSGQTIVGAKVTSGTMNHEICMTHVAAGARSFLKKKASSNPVVKCKMFKRKTKMVCASKTMKTKIFTTNGRVARKAAEAMSMTPAFRCGFFPSGRTRLAYVAYSMSVCQSDAMAQRISARSSEPCQSSQSGLFIVCTDHNGDSAIVFDWYSKPVINLAYRYTFEPWAEGELKSMGYENTYSLTSDNA